MIRRTNKITSLLLAAAAIASMVPAYAADVKKVDSQDGKVYNAVAYKDGEFYIDGEVNDKDEAAYYLANGKYNSLSDIDSGSDIAAYGTKYVDVNDGDYFIDLTSGKVTDENVADNARDDAASNLRKKVKADTDGRYVKDGLANAADYLQTLTSSDEISGSKFGDVWYATKLVNKNATNGLAPHTAAGITGTLNVFTDGSGNYIDADYNLGKIKVTTTCAGVSDKTVYIDNTDDTFDAANSGKVSASVVQKTLLGQDKDYIYRTATVTVITTGAGVSISQIDGKAVSCSAFTPSADGKTVSFDVIQKISKAQASSKKDGAKYAKTVTTYIISDDKAASKNNFENYGKYTIANGKVIGYNLNVNTGTVDIQTATLKSENGLYYTDLGSASNGDDVEKDSKLAIDVDADGNIWRLNSGYIYQWNNDEDWNKVYKVDGSFNNLSVYDKNNIVAWNQDNEVYSVIGGKKADNTDTTPTTPVVTSGWVKAADGTWSYNKADGTKVTGWIKDGGNWYYTNAAGVMQTGWQYVGGVWYYLNPTSNGTQGAMKTGWINDNGTWYYCNASGAMLANTVVDGYILGSSGAWIR